MKDWNLFYSAVTALIATLTLMGGLTVYFTKLIVMSTMSSFKNELLEQLNGRYLNANVANALIARADERQAQNRSDIEDLYRLLECKRSKV